MFFLLFFVFFPLTKTMRQPFSGTAERIFMKLLPNDTGKKCSLKRRAAAWRKSCRRLANGECWQYCSLSGTHMCRRPGEGGAPQYSGKCFWGNYHVKFGRFVNFSYIIFGQKMSCPLSWVWLSSYSHGRGLPAGLRWSWSSAALCWIKDIWHRQADLEQLCRQLQAHSCGTAF